MSGIDVLAVMDDDRTAVERMIDISETDAGIASWDAHLYRHDAARAAVAELIAANTELEEANADPRHTMGRDLRVINAEVRARAALARCRGGAA